MSNIRNLKSAAAPAASFEIDMTFSKETPGTFVFANEDAPVRTLYVRKEAYPNGAPEKITITVRTF